MEMKHIVKGIVPLRAMPFLAGPFLAVMMLAGCVDDPNAWSSVETAAGDRVLIPTKESGITLSLLHKYPGYAQASETPLRPVLFLHGGTFPGSATFGLDAGGGSWMDWMAQQGHQTYALDLRGYGYSSRPPQMHQAAKAHPPVVDTATALKDVATAVAYIRAHHGGQPVVLVGWSWGATLAGAYTTAHQNEVERLVLLSPPWLRDGERNSAKASTLGAWRSVPLSSLRSGLLRGVPEGKQAGFIPSGTVEAWTEALKASDPEGAKMNPPALKVPNGAGADTLKSWTTNKALWQPEAVTVPTLVVQGEWDAEAPPHMGLSVFARLTGAPVRRYILIGEGGHALFLEKNRQHLFRAVQSFLREPLSP